MSELTKTVTDQIRTNEAERTLTPDEANEVCGVWHSLAVVDMTDEEVTQYALAILYDLCQRFQAQAISFADQAGAARRQLLLQDNRQSRRRK